MGEGKLHLLLAVVRKLGEKRGLDEGQIVTAQSLAWRWADASPVDYPASHWARLACRHAWNGRDLPGCSCSKHDALNRTSQGAGMGNVVDRSPGPEVCAMRREEMARWIAGLTTREALLVALAIQGADNRTQAEALGVSQGRTSQMRRDMVERFGK